MFSKLDKWAKWLVIIMVILFILVSAKNITWGAPGIWHPDELAIRVIKTLYDEWEFDWENFDYPSLPKYAMLFVGELVQKFNIPIDLIVSMRAISAVLGAALIALTYRLARRAGAAPAYALLASGLAFTSSELLLNASFAHNDIYLAFFTALTTLALLRYSQTSERIWLYLSCLLVGMSASSKYNGASLVLVPFGLFLLFNFRTLFKDWLRTVETLGISIALVGFGYVVGTPRAALAFRFYYKNALPAIFKHSQYGWEPGAQTGIIIQWGQLISALGLPLFILSLAVVIYFLYQMIASKPWKADPELPHKTVRTEAVLLLVLLCYDLPILFSYNVQPRFFTAMIAPLAVLIALFVEKVYRSLKEREFAWSAPVTMIVLACILVFNGLRSAGVYLSFTNDQRIPATDYVAQLPSGTRIEYTLYPPNINRKQFYSAHNYPIQFLKFPDQEIPTSPYFVFNSGEEGIEDRQPDYLVIDSFTYARFDDEYICEIHPADCAFFTKLLAGEANYKLIQSFHYQLPAYIPDVNVAFLNPDIQVYQRTAP